MKLVYLGSGNAFTPRRDQSCLLLNDTILLEAAPNVLANLKRVSADLKRISHIFLSHFHGDHFLGLPFLLLEYHFLSRTDAPLTLVGPLGVEEKTRALMTLAFPDLAKLGWPRPTHFIEVEPNKLLDADGIPFSAVEMAHGNGALTAYGYRLYTEEGIVAYSGDTCMTPALFSLVEDARVVIVEADSADDSAVHLGRNALRELLARVPKDAAVFLTHLDTPDGTAWRGMPVIIPRDLQTFHISLALEGPPEVQHD